MVRATSAGVIEDFTLAEGDIVEAGQHLGRITADGAIAGEGTRLAAELARIETHITNGENEQRQTLAVADVELAMLSQEGARIQARVERLNVKLDLRQAAAKETRAAFDRIVALEVRGVASEQQLSVVRLQVIAAEQRVVELQSELAEQLAELRGLPQRRGVIEAQTKLKVMQLQAELDSLRGERSILSATQSFAVTAPVEGRVSAVRVRNGHEVQEGEPLFSILPAERALEAELYVPSRAIGFVKVGLDVRLLLDAFPYQRFGTTQGEIVEVTTTVLQPGMDETLVQIEEPVFRATVALAADAIEHDGTEHPLQVGMTLTGNIILEERTILSLVFEPVVSVLRRY